MNLVIAIGNMTDDPKIDVYNEHKKASFSLALNRGKDGADFPRFVAWDKKAELMEQYCHKGTKLAIRGHIQTGSYLNMDKKKVYTTDIIVDELEFCDKKPKDETTGQPTENPADDWMKIPDGIKDEEFPFK